jgi:8-oxo-dGTP diphosphatase
MSHQSIACIAFEGRKVLIARRNPVGQMGGRWEFPGGKVEPGETEPEAVCREFREEFGIGVTAGDLIAEAVFKHNGDLFSLHAYCITVPHPGIEKKYELTEHTEYRWVALSEIPRLSFVDSDLLIYPQVVKYFADTVCQGADE